MKSSLLLILLLLASIGRADIIAQWNFNSVPPDNSHSTGTNIPSVGTGAAALVGGVTASFSDGLGSADPAPTSDDSAWNTRDYPPLSQANKTAGVEFAT